MIFEVNRSDLRSTRVADTPPAALTTGQIRLSVERFAFTTNNVTYAVAGDMLDYWGFFPAEAPWGHIPAMGLATVAESAHPDIDTGGRWFGFHPMANESVITAEPKGDGFRDIGEHRGAHAPVYREFRSVENDSMFRTDKCDEYLLLWGMFMTSFLVDDHLADPSNEGGAFLGAAQTLITSASSKTSISLAACLAERDGNESVGLTSERNRTFVEGLGLYDQVLTYDEVGQLNPATMSVLVDMAGSGEVRSSVHNHFVDTLRSSVVVGATHWEDQAGPAAMPGPAPEFFFAPGQNAKLTADLGAEELERRMTASFGRLLDSTDRWLTVEHRTGGDGIEATYRDLLEGRTDPAVGFVCAMDESTLA